MLPRSFAFFMAVSPPSFSGIRHIIFDLGGVLLNIDYAATEQAFEALGVPGFGKRFSKGSQNTFFDDWETGRIGTDSFIAGMREASGNAGLSDRQILDAWNAMLFDFPLRRLQLLQQLRNQYDLILLSNTNAVHVAAFDAILMSTCGYNSIGHFFDKVYYSHLVGLRKPDEKIFRLILDQNDFQPEHTLFIDDSPQHIETAARLGIRTIHLTAGMTVEDDIFLPKGER